MIDINFAEVLEYAKQRDADLEPIDGEEADVGWRTEITKMIIAEVGEGDNEYLISW